MTKFKWETAEKPRREWTNDTELEAKKDGYYTVTNGKKTFRLYWDDVIWRYEKSGPIVRWPVLKRFWRFL